MKCPINHITIAQNSNRTVVDYRESGKMTSRASIATLANAMDVRHPSNFPRLQALYPSISLFKEQLDAVAVSDDQIKSTIVTTYQKHHMIICPHTATAVHALEECKKKAAHWIIAATADPCKFETVVEPLINTRVKIPLRFQKQLNMPSLAIPIEAKVETLLAALS